MWPVEPVKAQYSNFAGSF
uniref:Uncharacterized protein n=1 Tax=Arundo donax TaxID=35708 RepID=A0A0A9BQ63_ARUDO